MSISPHADIPLVYDPGDAIQIDWGEATAYIDGCKTKIYFFCGRLCYSCAIFVQAFYSQNKESFLEAQQKIRRIFDADYKRLDRRKKAQERNNVVIMSVTTMVADFEEVGDYEIPDDTYNPEVLILHEIELAELREHLAELDDEDRQFLMDCFDSQIGCAAAGEAIGLTKNQAHYKKVKLLEELRKKMK